MNKKTILLCIANYELTNRNNLAKCLTEYNSFQDYKIDCHLFLTQPIDITPYPNIRFIIHTFSALLGQGLVLEHKRVMIDSVGRYDYYLYSEDDIFITENNIKEWEKFQSKIPNPFSCGFLRYENKSVSDYKFLFDTHPTHSVHRQGAGKIVKEKFLFGEDEYVDLYNIHQGCYLITNSILETVVSSGKYDECVNLYVGTLEAGASDVYYKCGITRVLPTKNIKGLLVHHMSDKYVKKLPEFYTEESTMNEVVWEKTIDTGV